MLIPAGTRWQCALHREREEGHVVGDYTQVKSHDGQGTEVQYELKILSLTGPTDNI